MEARGFTKRSIGVGQICRTNDETPVLIQCPLLHERRIRFTMPMRQMIAMMTAASGENDDNAAAVGASDSCGIGVLET